MAKKKQESGPGTFMILVLVFFVLASLILGVTTYMGYSKQEELETQAKKANEDAKKAQDNAAEQVLRRNVDRVACGTATPDDVKDLNGAPPAQMANVLEEIKMLTEGMGKAGVLPGGKNDGFSWPVAGEAGSAVSPKKTLTQIAKEWFKVAQDFKAKFESAEQARKTADAATQAAQAQREKDKEAFDASVKGLNDQMVAKIQDNEKRFLALKTEAEKAGAKFDSIEKQWAEEKTKLEEQLGNKNNEITILIKRIQRAENPDPSDLDARWKFWNPAKIAERMGTVTEKNGEFVNIQFSQQLVLLPGQTFVVIAPNRSLVEVLEREKALEKKHHDFTSLGQRDPFFDNEMIKGMVEITDVTSKYTARARMTYQHQQIRNPISKGDQLFNMTLNSGSKEHVAIAGIIDLDGDGRPDTEQFIRLLEKNNLIVDAYLDLKTGEIKGKGMNSGTRFLILGPESPPIGNLKVMMKQAQTNGSQLIDARMFMNLIGIKPPKNPAPPIYASVNLGTESPAPKDDAPMPPAADPKKN